MFFLFVKLYLKFLEVRVIGIFIDRKSLFFANVRLIYKVSRFCNLQHGHELNEKKF